MTNIIVIKAFKDKTIDGIKREFAEIISVDNERAEFLIQNGYAKGINMPNVDETLNDKIEEQNSLIETLTKENEELKIKIEELEKLKIEIKLDDETLSEKNIDLLKEYNTDKKSKKGE